MKILYGTTNKGKLQAMEIVVKSLGFPLDSLSIDIASGKYYYDLEVKDVSTSVDDGVRKFFTEILQKL